MLFVHTECDTKPWGEAHKSVAFLPVCRVKHATQSHCGKPQLKHGLTSGMSRLTFFDMQWHLCFLGQPWFKRHCVTNMFFQCECAWAFSSVINIRHGPLGAYSNTFGTHMYMKIDQHKHKLRSGAKAHAQQHGFKVDLQGSATQRHPGIISFFDAIDVSEQRSHGAFHFDRAVGYHFNLAAFCTPMVFVPPLHDTWSYRLENVEERSGRQLMLYIQQHFYWSQDVENVMGAWMYQVGLHIHVYIYIYTHMHAHVRTGAMNV